MSTCGLCSTKECICVFTIWGVLHCFLSTSRGHPCHFGERTAEPADWPRRLQAQRYLCICTNRQWKDSCIRHTCNPGESKQTLSEEGTCGVCRWTQHVFIVRFWCSGSCVKSGLWPCCPPKSLLSRSEPDQTQSGPHDPVQYKLEQLTCPVLLVRCTKCSHRMLKEPLWEFWCWQVRRASLQNKLHYQNTGEWLIDWQLRTGDFLLLYWRCSILLSTSSLLSGCALCCAPRRCFSHCSVKVTISICSVLYMYDY